MKRKISMLIVLALLATILGGCQLLCKHEWAEATCETPKTCAKCGKTEGEALGHAWAEATCEAPETCTACGMMRGEAKGHQWEEATCLTPKTCAVCDATEGEALGHAWEEATTEAPQTCSVCQLTEGEPLDTDDRFTTAATKELQGKWVTYVEMSGEEMGIAGADGMLKFAMYMEFGNTGDWSIRMGIEDEEAFNARLVEMMADALYAEFAAMGVDAVSANEAMLETYGMTVEDYAALSVSYIDFSALLSVYNLNAVYYVEGDQLYSSVSWNTEFTGEGFWIEDGVLTIETATWGEDQQMMQWTRMEE